MVERPRFRDDVGPERESSSAPDAVGDAHAGEPEQSDPLLNPDAFDLVEEFVHDIRSPLNSILFLSEVLRSGHSGPVSDHQRSQLGLIYSATLGLISVANDVMEMAGERTGLGGEESTDFSLGRMFDSVHEMVRPMAEQKGLRLEFRLPDVDRFHGHPGRLGRVLLNLTTNALKFTNEGAVVVQADMLGGSRVEISVEDTGPGIPREKLSTLFQAFHKAPYRDGHFFSSSGLGLSIAQRLVVAMGSELQVRSDPRTGTRFWFVLELPTVAAG